MLNYTVGKKQHNNKKKGEKKKKEMLQCSQTYLLNMIQFGEHCQFTNLNT